MPGFEQDFRGHVLRGAAETISISASKNILFREPEIRYPNVSLRIYQYVFRLEVPVDYILLVQVLDCEHNLGSVETRLVFR